jgi:hypothetical protein
VICLRFDVCGFVPVEMLNLSLDTQRSDDYGCTPKQGSVSSTSYDATSCGLLLGPGSPRACLNTGEKIFSGLPERTDWLKIDALNLKHSQMQCSLGLV